MIKNLVQPAFDNDYSDISTSNFENLASSDLMNALDRELVEQTTGDEQIRTHLEKNFFIP